MGSSERTEKVDTDNMRLPSSLMFSLIVVLLLLPLWNNILLQHISFPLYQVASGLSSVFLFLDIIALLFCIYFTDYANIATYTSMVTFLLLLVTSFLRVRLHWSVVSSAKRLEE